MRHGSGTRTGAEGLGVLLEELRAHELVQVPVLLAAPPVRASVRDAQQSARGLNVWAVEGTYPLDGVVGGSTREKSST